MVDGRSRVLDPESARGLCQVRFAVGVFVLRSKSPFCFPTTTRSLGAVFECVVAETLGADVLAVPAFVAERAL